MNKEAEKERIKMDGFSSKAGTMTKFIDYKLPNLKTYYSTPETHVRKVINGMSAVYFYQIERQGEYGTTIISIEYSVLIEAIKALEALSQQVDDNVTTNPDYLENKFTTTDDFELGYFVSNGEVTWYLKLNNQDSDNTLFLSDANTIGKALKYAKDKIDSIK